MVAVLPWTITPTRVGPESRISIPPPRLAWLAETGYDPVYGARPLKRAIQRHLEDPLAKRLLAGEYAPGDLVLVELRDGELSFGKTARAAT